MAHDQKRPGFPNLDMIQLEESRALILGIGQFNIDTTHYITVQERSSTKKSLSPDLSMLGNNSMAIGDG
jgi:hypothetical protein